MSDEVLDLLENSDRNIFVTGRAGTGKSWSLRNFVETTKKRVAVCAPTGKAAINVGGQTIHSMFRISGSHLDDAEILDAAKRQSDVVKRADAIIIDEISMGRVDLIETVHNIMRLARRRPDLPFGGCQMIFFGDVLQLPPIVQQDEADYFYSKYKTPYFFSANCLKEGSMDIVELMTVFRQTESEFIEILNGVRNGQITEFGLQKLNSRVNASFGQPDGFITITPYNKKATAINDEKLKKLAGKEVAYNAVVYGEFSASQEPADKVLRLKEGAQVMFIKNAARTQEEIISDSPPKWVNGSMGIVEECLASEVLVRILDGHNEGDIVSVKKMDWEIIKHEMVDDMIQKNVAGSFSQIPLKLGYAGSVHKCVSPDTIVETQLGLQEIKNIAEIGEIATPVGVSTYRNLVKNRTSECLLMTTNDLYSIEVTVDHVCEVIRDGKKEMVVATDVKVGDFVRLRLGSTTNQKEASLLPAKPIGDVRCCDFRFPKTVTNEVATFLGLMVADGSIYKGGFRLAKRHKDVVDWFELFCKSEFGVTAIKRFMMGNAYVAEVNSTLIRSWFEQVGGLSPNKKDIPKCIMESSAETQAAFLKGLFEDGTVNINKNIGTVSFTSLCPTIIRKVRSLLLRCGIACTSTKNRKHTIFIYAEFADVFRNRIGFISSAKNQKLKTARLGNGTRHAVPVSPEIIETASQARLISKSMAATCRKTGYLSRATANFINAKMPGLLDHDQWHYTTIDNIKTTVSESMCVEVPGVGRFLQNGFPHSNSQGASLDRMILDLDRGAFDFGQTYVALSRCRSFGNLVLTSPVSRRDIKVDKRVLDYLASIRESGQLREINNSLAEKPVAEADLLKVFRESRNAGTAYSEAEDTRMRQLLCDPSVPAETVREAVSLIYDRLSSGCLSKTTKNKVKKTLESGLASIESAIQ